MGIFDTIVSGDRSYQTKWQRVDFEGFDDEYYEDYVMFSVYHIGASVLAPDGRYDAIGSIATGKVEYDPKFGMEFNVYEYVDAIVTVEDGAVKSVEELPDSRRLI